MTNKTNDENNGKKLPIKMISILIFILFIILVIGYMILPAYFDKNPFGTLLTNEPAPWAISDDQGKIMQLTEAQNKGKQHYLEYCASCHGPKGKGDGPSSITLRKKLPNFLDPNAKYFNNFDKEGLLKTINNGIPESEMPSFHYLPEEVKEDLAEFLIYINKYKNYN